MGDSDGTIILGVPLLPPRIGCHAITILFPEAGLIFGKELQSVNPLCAFPCVASWCEDAHRTTMPDVQRLAIERMCEDNIFLQHYLQREIGRVAAIRVLHHKLRFRFERNQL